MTMLRKLLIFNAPQKERKCNCCNGTGKIKSPKMLPSTTGFCLGTGAVWMLSMTRLFSSSPNYSFILPLFVISTIIAVLALIEYHEQVMGGEYGKKRKKTISV